MVSLQVRSRPCLSLVDQCLITMWNVRHKLRCSFSLSMYTHNLTAMACPADMVNQFIMSRGSSWVHLDFTDFRASEGQKLNGTTLNAGPCILAQHIDGLQIADMIGLSTRESKTEWDNTQGILVHTGAIHGWMADSR